jgi:hypothetical protein
MVPRERRRLCPHRKKQTPLIYECRFIAAENSNRYELARCASRVAQRAGARIEGVSNLSITLRTNPSRQRHWLPRRLRRSTSGAGACFDPENFT